MGTSQECFVGDVELLLVYWRWPALPNIEKAKGIQAKCRRLCFCQVTALIVLFSCHHSNDSIKKPHSWVWPGPTRFPVIDRQETLPCKGEESTGRDMNIWVDDIKEVCNWFPIWASAAFFESVHSSPTRSLESLWWFIVSSWGLTVAYFVGIKIFVTPSFTNRRPKTFLKDFPGEKWANVYGARTKHQSRRPLGEQSENIGAHSVLHSKPTPNSKA